MRRFYFLPLSIVGALMCVLIFFGRNSGPVAAYVALAITGFAGAFYGFWAVRWAASRWNFRVRTAWTCIALSGVAFGIGCLLKLRNDPAEMLVDAARFDWRAPEKRPTPIARC